MILGADRVGKSTLVGHLQKELNGQIFHFSGPQPEHNSPIDQYIIPLSQSLSSPHENIICDRGGCEVCFYEAYRRGIEIDISWVHSFESWCLSNFSNVFVIVVRKDWDRLMIRRHLNELSELYPNATSWYKMSQLTARENEHNDYYEYMYDYFSLSNKQGTLISQENILYTSHTEDIDAKYLLKKLAETQKG